MNPPGRVWSRPISGHHQPDHQGRPGGGVCRGDLHTPGGGCGGGDRPRCQGGQARWVGGVERLGGCFCFVFLRRYIDIFFFSQLTSLKHQNEISNCHETFYVIDVCYNPAITILICYFSIVDNVLDYQVCCVVQIVYELKILAEAYEHASYTFECVLIALINKQELKNVLVIFQTQFNRQQLLAETIPMI